MRTPGVTRSLACLVLVTACGGDGATPSVGCPPSPFRSSPPVVIAHAGGEGLGPANTILAMERSLEAGADVLDADLWMTLDGVIVAHHDRDVGQATDGEGMIDQLTFAALERLDTRSGWSGAPIDRPVRIPALAQVLEAFPTEQISVEIKQREPSMASALCDVLEAHDALGRVYVSANDDDALYAAKAACAGMTITTTYRDVAAMNAARATGGPWCAPAPIGQPPYREGRLTAESLKWSHDHGMAIYTWTVDDPEVLRTLAAAGVDGVYTRRPDIARAVFDEIAGRSRSPDQGTRSRPGRTLDALIGLAGG